MKKLIEELWNLALEELCRARKMLKNGLVVVQGRFDAGELSEVEILDELSEVEN